MFEFGNYSTKSKYYDNSNKLMAGKMEDKTNGAAIEEVVRSNPKMYLCLVRDKIEHKKAKGVNKNLLATISYCWILL